MRPDRVVVGGDDPNAIQIMRELYAPITRNHERMIVMGIRDAEMTKYAANAMLATRISFMNEIADICESVGADVESVRVGIGSDTRIGYSFIYAGCGYGGSCFPKDDKALIRMAGMAQRPSRLLEAVEARNESQKHVLAQKIISKFGPDLSGKTIGVWGLAFKPGTEDMREAPSLVLIRDVVRAGGKIKAYDPVAAETARERIPEKWLAEGQVQIVAHQYEAIEDADAMTLVTEWKPFRQPDFRAMKRLMRGTAIFDGRNQYDPLQARRHGFEYYGIERAAAQTCPRPHRARFRDVVLAPPNRPRPDPVSTPGSTQGQHVPPGIRVASGMNGRTVLYCSPSSGSSRWTGSRTSLRIHRSCTGLSAFEAHGYRYPSFSTTLLPVKHRNAYSISILRFCRSTSLRQSATPQSWRESVSYRSPHSPEDACSIQTGRESTS